MIRPLIVLRFRDIELESGQTITLHRRIIGQYGACWWGWLYRDHERNPHAELAEIHQQLRGPIPYPVALYNTNEGRIYHASCTGLEAAVRLMRTPALELTPSYYRNRQAPAWFRFEEIADADESFVIGRRCVQLPSASEDCYVDLLGRMVNKLVDLRRQEVTLWILE